jgi:hypothetical protein
MFLLRKLGCNPLDMGFILLSKFLCDPRLTRLFVLMDNLHCVISSCMYVCFGCFFPRFLFYLQLNE